jgi:hypothetical protein
VTEYLIWSNQHRAWRGPSAAGYVYFVAEASRYSREAAFEIAFRALPGQWQPGLSFPEIPVLEADAEALEEAGRKLWAARPRRKKAG